MYIYICILEYILYIYIYLSPDKCQCSDPRLVKYSETLVYEGTGLRRHWFTSTQVFVLTYLIQQVWRHPPSLSSRLRYSFIQDQCKLEQNRTLLRNFKIHTHPLGDTVWATGWPPETALVREKFLAWISRGQVDLHGQDDSGTNPEIGDPNPHISIRTY